MTTTSPIAPPAARAASGRLARAAALYVRLVEWLAMAGMVALVVVAGLQVWFRYVVGASLFWSEELLRYLMIWCAMLVGGISYSRGEMLGMRLAVDALPGSLRRAVDLLGRVAVLALLLVIAWYGLEFALRTTRNLATAMRVSMFWIHLSVPVGSLLIALHVLADILTGRPASDRNEPEQR